MKNFVIVLGKQAGLNTGPDSEGKSRTKGTEIGAVPLEKLFEVTGQGGAQKRSAFNPGFRGEKKAGGEKDKTSSKKKEKTTTRLSGPSKKGK